MEVRNKKLYKGEGLYIGRGSIFGNDWTHLRGSTQAMHQVKDLNTAVFAYADWVINGMDTHAEAIRDQLWAWASYELQIRDGGVRPPDIVICWCVDRNGNGNCHGRFLKIALESLVEIGHFEEWGAYWMDRLDDKRQERYQHYTRCTECNKHSYFFGWDEY